MPAAEPSVAELEAVRVQAQAAASSPLSSALSSPLARMLGQVVERIGGHAHVRAVFGEPVTQGSVTVIPVARVFGGFGGGAGSEDAEHGVGIGGGFAALPAGFIELKDGEARYRALDPFASGGGVYGAVATVVGNLALFAADKLKRRKAAKQAGP
jgi:uncharacterized spore protein YtfJ